MLVVLRLLLLLMLLLDGRRVDEEVGVVGGSHPDEERSGRGRGRRREKERGEKGRRARSGLTRFFASSSFSANEKMVYLLGEGLSEYVVVGVVVLILLLKASMKERGEGGRKVLGV